eukprot:scaffold61414_cov25-Tisochrysis_lutea.AAC.4
MPLISDTNTSARGGCRRGLSADTRISASEAMALALAPSSPAAPPTVRALHTPSAVSVSSSACRLCPFSHTMKCSVTVSGTAESPVDATSSTSTASPSPPAASPASPRS